MSDLTFPSHYTRLDKLYAIQLTILISITESYDYKTDTGPEGLTLSSLLKALIDTFGFSLDEISKNANCSKMTIRNYMAGKLPQDVYAAAKRKRVKGAILKVLNKHARNLPPIEPEF